MEIYYYDVIVLFHLQAILLLYNCLENELLLINGVFFRAVCLKVAATATPCTGENDPMGSSLKKITIWVRIGFGFKNPANLGLSFFNG